MCSMFADTPDLETRALEMSDMLPMLKRLAERHRKLERHVTPSRFWRAMRRTGEVSERQESHMRAAEHAGFIENVSSNSSDRFFMRLTRKGWRVIEEQPPIWMDI